MRRLLPLLFVLIAACGGDDSDNIMGPAAPPATIPDFTGLYTYSGTVNGEPDLSLAGTLSITNQQASSATVVSNISLRSSGIVVLVFTTVTPPQASLGADGSISFTHVGAGDFGEGVNRNWTLRHDGTLSGNLISGTWSLTVSGLGTDAGSFSAQR